MSGYATGPLREGAGGCERSRTVVSSVLVPTMTDFASRPARRSPIPRHRPAARRRSSRGCSARPPETAPRLRLRRGAAAVEPQSRRRNRPTLARGADRAEARGRSRRAPIRRPTRCRATRRRRSSPPRGWPRTVTRAWRRATPRAPSTISSAPSPSTRTTPSPTTTSPKLHLGLERYDQAIDVRRPCRHPGRRAPPAVAQPRLYPAGQCLETAGRFADARGAYSALATDPAQRRGARGARARRQHPAQP